MSQVSWLPPCTGVPTRPGTQGQARQRPKRKRPNSGRSASGSSAGGSSGKGRLGRVAAGDAEESLGAALVAQRALVAGALLGLGVGGVQLLDRGLRLLKVLLLLGLVDPPGLVAVLDQHEDAVGVDLQVSLPLGEVLDL